MDLKQPKDLLLACDVPQTIEISSGLFGYHNIQTYVIKKMQRGSILSSFRLLESIHNPTVVFVIKPIDSQDNLIAEADFQQAVQHLDFNKTSTQAYAIVTLTRQRNNALDFYLNLKAPIVVDWSTNMAEQYVFTNNKYPLQHGWYP